MSGLRIAVTGGDGFIGRNLRVRLQELGTYDVASIDLQTPPNEFCEALGQADFVFHLAGVNRPPDPREFEAGNAGLTAEVCNILRATGRKIPIVLTSSIQAERENAYGRSKLSAEVAAERYAADTGAPAFVFRLPNVFGKWSRPNYNSGVATFCHNLANGLSIRIDDPATPLRLVYIDDVVHAMLALLGPGAAASGRVEVSPVYETTVGKVAELLQSFVALRTTNVVPTVGLGLERALYSTFLSFLRPEAFAYPLRRHDDARGSFVEMLRTESCGQFSYFTAQPGVTRGGHYHHTKTEKFLVVQGSARFGFRHIVSGETHQLDVAGESARVVETVPGWAHDITNIGADELIVLLWANEQFDPNKPDTIASKVLQ